MKLNFYLLLGFVFYYLVVETNQQIFEIRKNPNFLKKSSQVNNHPVIQKTVNTSKPTIKINTVDNYSEMSKLHKIQKGPNYKYEEKMNKLPEAFALRKIHKVKKEENILAKKVKESKSEIDHLKSQIVEINVKNKKLENFIKENSKNKNSEISMLQKVENELKNSENTINQNGKLYSTT